MNIGVPNIQDLQELAELIVEQMEDATYYSTSESEEMIYETLYDWCRDILKVTPMNRK